jgi:hypothetical protein
VNSSDSPERSLGKSPIVLQRPAAITAAVVVACIAAFIAAPGTNPGAPISTDIDQLWHAARALVRGSDPYSAVGPGSPFPGPYKVMYPLPAILIAVPFSWFPIEVLRATVAASGAGLLTYCIARTDARGLVILLSRAFYLNIALVNWTPLLMLIWWWPRASVLVAIKPTIGIEMLAGLKRYQEAIPGLISAACLTGLCFAIRPTWLADWLQATQSGPTTRPWILTPWAFIVLAALVFPRRWQSRFLAVFMLVPQTPHPIAALPLILLPVTWPGKALIALLTYLPAVLINREPFGSRIGSTDDMHTFLAQIMLWTVIVPTLCFVLWDGYRERAVMKNDEVATDAPIVDR